MTIYAINLHQLTTRFAGKTAIRLGLHWHVAGWASHSVRLTRVNDVRSGVERLLAIRLHSLKIVRSWSVEDHVRCRDGSSHRNDALAFTARANASFKVARVRASRAGSASRRIRATLASSLSHSAHMGYPLNSTAGAQKRLSVTGEPRGKTAMD